MIDRAASDATDKFPSYIGASVHFSFRHDAIGRVSRLRVFSERASDRRIAQVGARSIQAAHFSATTTASAIGAEASLV